MKKLLITGASGFVGSRIAAHYAGRYEIYAPKHETMDITDEVSVKEYFANVQPDYVVHCAAVSDTGRCQREPELSWKINVTGSVNIAKASKDVGAKCVLCSSDQVYFGSDVMTAHKEEEVLVPANVYGKEKLKGEELCLAVNPESVHLRLAWMYDGRNCNYEIHRDFMSTVKEKLQNKETFAYPVHDMRGITDVWEVVENMEKTFDLPGGVYNFGSWNGRSTYDTVKRVFEELGLPSTWIEKNETAFADKPRNLTMDQEKISGFGIVFRDTETAIKSNLEYVTNQ